MQVQTTHINTEPGFKPSIEGTRITVQHVARHHEYFGWSAEEIAEAYQLSLAQVYAALAYYHDHKEDIDRAIQQDREQFAKLPRLDPESELRLVMTPQEIADEFPITVDAVYQAIRRGKIYARKSGAIWLIRRHDAEKLWAGKH